MNVAVVAARFGVSSVTGAGPLNTRPLEGEHAFRHQPPIVGRLGGEAGSWPAFARSGRARSLTTGLQLDTYGYAPRSIEDPGGSFSTVSPFQ